MDPIEIRRYRRGEEKALWKLFHDTIRSVNRKDYSREQVEVWAPDKYDLKKWTHKIAGITPFVAVTNQTIVGYANLQQDGYIDHFFCHKDWHGRGVGSVLMDGIFTEANQCGIQKLYANVSITAKAFFERKGFKVIRRQEVTIEHQTFINFRMEKNLS